MKRRLLLPCLLLNTTLLAGLFCYSTVAQAQAPFSLGPQVGLNYSTASYWDDAYHTRYRSGLEAGVLGSLRVARATLQAALLFSQKGYHVTSGDSQNPTVGGHDDHIRRNYLSLPLHVLFTPRRDGQGLQLLAGPYVSVLVGGHYERAYTFNYLTTLTEGPIVPNQSSASYDEYSSLGVDYGAAAGLGYCYKRLQLQLKYSWGWQSLAVDYTSPRGQRLNSPNYTNRALQASLAYLFPL